MSNNLFKGLIVIGILIILNEITSGISIYKLKTLNDYINITPEEAWDLLKDTSNGIQIPIDVRSPNEWLKKRIDTPFPEFPRRYSNWTPTGLEEFVSLYNNSVVVLYCRSGDRSNAAARHIVEESDFNGTIYNMLGGINQWIEDDLPTKYFNHLPNQPETPVGPTIGVIEISNTFSTITTDSDNDPVRYGWSWDGDNVTDEWSSYYPSDTIADITHSWSNPGTYDILVIAQDNVGEQSEFSDVLTVNITTKPNPPIINGKLNGKAGEDYDFIFSTLDPDNDNIFLYVEWGDESIKDYNGPYQSEEKVILNHTYTEEGNYTIRAKAKDIYDIESEWATLVVNMPKTKVFNRSILNILEQYPKLFPILTHLLQKL
ncbi:MAG: hypothetical protein JSV67_06870 [Thermoplasmatales archaeon]|nr:MAG: hypothetical protein JSV67_06870 [Thermoplasmatales archaeon]